MALIRSILLLLFVLNCPAQELGLRNPAFVSRLTPVVVVPFTYTATVFDGTDYIYTDLVGDNYTGEADGKQFTCSFWMKVSGGDGTTRYIYRDGGDLVQIILDSDNTMKFFTQTAGGASYVVRFFTSATFTSGATWHHICISVNVDGADTGKRHFFVNGAQDGGTWHNFSDSTAAYANGGDHGIAASATGSLPFTGSLSEFFLDTSASAYIDLTVGANLLKFRTAGGKPADLGANGSTPLGVQPLVYLHNGYATFQNNLGSGGNFTVGGGGALTDDASIP